MFVCMFVCPGAGQLFQLLPLNNIMQKREQIQLLSHPKCIQLCSSPKPNHQGNHQQISLSTLTQLLKQLTMNTKLALFDSYYTAITDSLTRLRDAVDVMLAEVGKDIERCRCELALGLTDKGTIEACVEIARDQIGDIGKVRCCDVYQLYAKIGEFGFGDVPRSKIEDKIRTTSDRILSDINDELKNIEKAVGSLKQETAKKLSSTETKTSTQSETKPMVKKQKQKEERLPVKRQQKYEYQSDGQQARPIREPAERKPRLPEAQSKPTFPISKISSLEFTKQGQRFNIRVKVLRVIKNFNIKNDKKVEFRAGDESGTAICVMNDNDLIQNNNTIEVTNCRIYEFKGKIKQIQSNRDSKIFKVENIRTVGKNFELSENHDYPKTSRTEQRSKNIDKERKHSQEQQEQEEPNFYNKVATTTITDPSLTKIGSIEPENEGLTLVAQVYKILSCSQHRLLCYLGDETGVVKAELPANLSFIREDATIKLTKVDANVIREHILVRTNKNSKIESTNTSFSIIKINNDVSAEEWIEEEDK